jgi:hypothetical protein
VELVGQRHRTTSQLMAASRVFLVHVFDFETLRILLDERMQLGDAVASRSVSVVKMCYGDAVGALREVVAAITPPAAV